MTRYSRLLAVLPLALLAACAHQAMDAQAVLRGAEQAMGGTNLKTLRYAGSGMGASFGQAWVPGEAWPRLNITGSRIVDYENGALREEGARSRSEPNGGGAVPLMGTGEQRTTGLLRGTHAWNLVGPAPVPAPLAVDARIHDLWTTPHGVLKAAMKNSPSARSEGGKTVVSFTEPGRFKARVWVGADGLVERVDSVQPNAVMGDTEVSTIYSGYRDHGGVKFPGRIQQTQGGFPVLDMNVTEVQPNAPAPIELPALVPAFAERAVSEKVADGVWHIAGGSHNSVLIEMRDHLILVETPLYDGRSLAVIAEARRLVPGKPIRYAVNSHHHFDHAGGLRTAVSEGITLVTSEQAKPWYEKTFANPNSINPDALQRSGRKASVVGVAGMRDIGDASRPVIVHSIDSSIHAQGFNMVWLPRERLLIEADAFTPGAPGAAPPTPPNLNHVNLWQNIQRLRLDVDRILPLHGRVVPLAELRTAVGAR
ncbi:MBL fold metallo-hydrolase [Caenimonas sedimenti]|uniref:MBL fold metallo-hydrolase n=1 Tax=Caenimonas sedimenti TaxID=2596921 RepID=A0A562ZKC9_9BURK|nr:MBL fold metallo-hydrolase [Caenimonas sedimenti]TWO68847.1 MBL fold metallo-hydrolase [Caenimonas sedimenti]